MPLDECDGLLVDDAKSIEKASTKIAATRRSGQYGDETDTLKAEKPHR
jgi:hypothetical protein